MLDRACEDERPTVLAQAQHRLDDLVIAQTTPPEPAKVVRGKFPESLDMIRVIQVHWWRPYLIMTPGSLRNET
mgnify:CR=1 FL=1